VVGYQGKRETMPMQTDPGPQHPVADGLLVVAVDRLPAWLLPAYGATWVAMPALDRVAARGVVCDRAIAAGDDAARTLGELLGGRAAGPPWPLVAAAAARGWPATLVTDDAAVAAAAGGSGLTVTHVPPAAAPTPAADEGATGLGRLFAAAAAPLAAGPQGLVVVQATSLGRLWDAPEELRLAYVDPDDPPPPAGVGVPEFRVSADTDPDLLVGVRHVFAGQLTLLDRCLGRLLESLPARWGVAVVGLRGLGLGLHGQVGPAAMPPFGELVHVPAILADPIARMAGQRHGGLVTPADVGATLVEWVAGAAPRDAARPAAEAAGLEGLFAAWQPPPRDRVVVVAAAGAAVATPGWMLVAPRGERPRLFAKPDDFFELNDVADRCPAEAEELGRLLADVAAGRPERAWTTPLSAGAIHGTD
jgi:arylsulfatase A-like enzyme